MVCMHVQCAGAVSHCITCFAWLGDTVVLRCWTCDWRLPVQTPADTHSSATPGKYVKVSKRVSETQFKGGFSLCFGCSDQVKMSSVTVWNDYMTNKSAVYEVCRQMVPDLRSCCTEGSVAEVGARPTDEKRSRLSWEQFFWASISEEAAVLCRVAGSVPRQCLVDNRVATLNSTLCRTGS